jgi:ATP-dependent Lon protease
MSKTKGKTGAKGERLGGEDSEGQRKVPDLIPLLPVRDIVVFPYMIVPLFVGREKSIRAVDEALSRDRLIFLVAQKDAEAEDPGSEEIFEVGTVGLIMRILKMPDGRIKVLLQGIGRARIEQFVRQEPYFEVRISEIHEIEIPSPSLATQALVRSVKELVARAAGMGKSLSPDVLAVVNGLEDPGRLADLVASNLDLKVSEAEEILSLVEPISRLRRLSQLVRKELEVLKVQQEIQSQAKEEMEKTHREYYLREQLKAIQKELGGMDERAQEIQEFAARIEQAKMPKQVETEARRQLDRLGKMHPESAEATVVRNYLEWLTELPWSVQTRDRLQIERASRILDQDHYDLEKVKERILEFLAVRKLKKEMRGPILCFIGPPGVGKTSLGRSIARALGRKFVRISLGGVRDEAEIRGHRRTYIGALPGKIIQGIRQAGSNNPVFMIDEIEKIGMDFRGDPAAALLEVLDPEQNASFTDHYLGVPFDLSRVMFITTGNLTDPIPTALKDRMEIIHIPGYSEEEKLVIARRFLLPRQLQEHGLAPSHLTISDRAILKIISGYTREAGLRNLERELASICRKVARRVAEGNGGRIRLKPSNLHRYLGPPRFLAELEQERDEVGVATGLAWTETGGDVIYVEATQMRGKGNLNLTGHLGEVMKESAQAAWSFARATASCWGMKEDSFSRIDVHLHVPAGAVPKDGPSAGITMATSLVSLLTGHPVKKDVAMTGEVTLRGKILPVGGIKEKVLAARRAGIRRIILPAQNDKDLQEMPFHLRRGMEFILVKEMKEVLRRALVLPPSVGPGLDAKEGLTHLRSRTGEARA